MLRAFTWSRTSECSFADFSAGIELYLIVTYKKSERASRQRGVLPKLGHFDGAMKSEQKIRKEHPNKLIMTFNDLSVIFM